MSSFHQTKPIYFTKSNIHKYTLIDVIYDLRLLLNRVSAYSFIVILPLSLLNVFLSSSEGRIGDGIAFSFLLTFISWISLLYYSGINTCFMPHRRTDYLYLRSFLRDDDSWRFKVLLAEAVTTKYRVSGIRDPRKRSHGIIDFLLPAYWAMRYCTPRYMDLEAGKDWEYRIANQISLSRGVFIDIRNPTKYLCREIDISLKSTTVDRVFFIIDDRMPDVQWSKFIKSHSSVPKETVFKLINYSIVNDNRTDSIKSIKAMIFYTLGDAGKIDYRKPVLFPNVRTYINNKVMVFFFGHIMTMIFISILSFMTARLLFDYNTVQLCTISFSLFNIVMFVIGATTYGYYVGIRSERVKVVIGITVFSLFQVLILYFQLTLFK